MHFKSHQIPQLDVRPFVIRQSGKVKRNVSPTSPTMGRLVSDIPYLPARDNVLPNRGPLAIFT
jgi:hypothetical protein